MTVKASKAAAESAAHAGPAQSAAELRYLIEGIGPAYEAALEKLGIAGPADLAHYTPETLSKALLAQTGKAVPAKRIAAENWIGQARALAGENPTASAEKNVEGETTLTWNEHAIFTIFFENRKTASGHVDWRVRVYHEGSRTGVDPTFSLSEPDSLWDCLLDQADLPRSTAAAEAGRTAETFAEPSAPYAAHIAIEDVRLSAVRTDGDGSQELVADVDFAISGREAQTLAADRIAYKIDVHAVDLVQGVSTRVATSPGRLEPDRLTYHRRQRFPVLDEGRYEIHTVAQLLPPGEMMTFHRGPIIRIVP